MRGGQVAQKPRDGVGRWGIFFALHPNTFGIWCVTVRDRRGPPDPEEHRMAAAPRTIQTQPSVPSPEDPLAIAGPSRAHVCAQR